MIDGIEPYYQLFADGIVSKIGHDNWNQAWIDITFYPASTEITCRYIRSDSGAEQSFFSPPGTREAFLELRRMTEQQGKPLWCRARFELTSEGNFNLKLDYDGDSEGFAKFDEDKEINRFVD